MPDDLVVRFGLAGAYLEVGQAESAVRKYEEVATRMGDLQTKNEMEAFLRRLGGSCRERARDSCNDQVS